MGAYELEGAEREAFEALERAPIKPADTVSNAAAAGAAGAAAAAAAGNGNGNGERGAPDHASRRSRGLGQSKVMHSEVAASEGSDLGLGPGRTPVDMVAARDRLLGNVSEHAEVNNDDCEEAAPRRPLDDPGRAAEGVGGEDAHNGQPPTSMSSEDDLAHWEQWRTWASHWWWVWWAHQNFPAEGGYLTPMSTHAIATGD